MASNKIKGLTVEIGGDTTELGKALENVNKKSKDLSSELGQINRLLKMDPGNADLLAQKQKVLAEAVETTSEKLKKLKEAEKQVQAQFEKGEVSEEQVRELQREIIATTKKLEGYEKAAKETADAVEQLGDESESAAGDIDKMGDAADKAEDESEDLGSALDGTLSTGLKAVTALAVAAGAAIVGCVEASHEYRTAMGKLNTAFKTSGRSTETATKTYKKLQSVLGDTDQAVETANHLAKIADTEKELSAWTEIATGVYATFGDSLPVEGLAEAANETAKTGRVTGALADALNWATEEGEDFGVGLKKNIDFTQKSNKELEAMTEAQREEYEATKRQYEAIEEYNKKVTEATTAEDKFNIALENCTSEQERQELITKTLTERYIAAAKEYEKTNKRVIEANKANEEWNATLAEVGNEMVPVITEVKRFGTELLQNAKEPLKDVAGFLTGSVLPALSDLAGWVRDNTPVIEAGIAGVAAALVAYKVAVVATEVAHKGLKGAIMATEVAQKALNLVQAATPWGLAAVAIGAVVTALAVYATSVDTATEETEILTEEERELIAAAQETAAALKEQRDATAETAGSIMDNMAHVQKLADELQTLADKSGAVKDADKARVDFILNELNEALGTEYSMTDGVIQKYDELQSSINQVIQAKTTNSLLEAHNGDYVAAIQAEGELMEALALADQAYTEQRSLSAEKIKGYNEKIAEYEELLANATETTDRRKRDLWEGSLKAYEGLIDKEKGKIDEAMVKRDEAALAYGQNAETIMSYQEAETAALQGNHDRAIELLRGKSRGYHAHADEVDAATAEALDSLFTEAVNAGLAAQRTKRNFENGVKGYTQEMVTEAEDGYEDALAAYANAYTDAYDVGDDLSGGLEDGMEKKRGSLISKARSIVQSIIGAFREEADSNSPSRKMISFGEDMGEGAEIGLTSTTPDLLSTARKQVQELMSTYSGEGADVEQNVARGITERAATRSADNFKSYIDGNTSKLDQILTAIQRGQILTLDGKALVGATAEMTDSALGQRRALAARGAV